MTDSSQHLTAAISDLNWCLTIPHTLDRIIGLWAEHQDRNGRPLAKSRLTNDELVERISSGQGSGKGGHSDPTGNAAVLGAPDLGDDADETISRLTVATLTIWDATRDLTATLGHTVTLTPPKRHDRIQATVAQLHRLDVTDADLDALTPDERDHAHWLIADPIAATASWLHTKAESLWLETRGERQQVAPEVGRKMRPCACCTPYGYTEYAVDGSDLCERCDAFRRTYKCKPTRAILQQLVDYGRKRLSTKLIEEAKAAAKVRTG